MSDRAVSVRAGTRAVARPESASASGVVAARDLPRLLPSMRVGDFLGVGIVARPPPPPDPDVFDVDWEEKYGARALLTEEAKQTARETPSKPIEEVARILSEQYAGGEIDAASLDPETIAWLDHVTNYKVFLTAEGVMSREQLFAAYPFAELDVVPEAVFANQEVAIFPPPAHSISDDLEYMARDVGDDTTEFQTVDAMVARATGIRKSAAKRDPIKIVRTRVWLGKEQWDDFLQLVRTMRAAARIAQGQMVWQGHVSGRIAMLAGVSQAGAPLALRDSEGVEAEANERLERLERVEAAAAERERRMAEQERELQEQRRRMEEQEARIARDLARVDELMHILAASGAAKARGEGSGGSAEKPGDLAEPPGGSAGTPDGPAGALDVAGGGVGDAVPI